MQATDRRRHVLPGIRGQIERRLLVNYRVDAEVIARVLPHPFRPRLVGGAAVAGICLIRLGQMRPGHTPRWVGLRSENAAHRVAVEWDTPNSPQAGVYIPRRDSDSWVNVVLGGRVYPGEHHRARFRADETDEDVRVAHTSLDGSAWVDVSVHITDELGDSRLFAGLEEASAFFETGSVGYSATRRPNRFDGLGLKTSAWKVEPTSVTHAHSSFFDDARIFPGGTAELDDALIMRRVPVLWEPLASLRLQAEPAA
ncbi:DUF2071 domain-containing protein [Kribbella sp.]|uniref:DUF2071 domain-containing protein n=1 Tax=Kribbella sp. TaxID=1871183 RepID=UPI002D2408AA|nr:DUF2071 domain-containing protein [Kribbella sp.]HZX07263.1 DUF2071 domain-containing protein [Kribbella sp.]